MAVAGPSSSASPRPGAGVARRGRGDGDGAAVGLSSALATGDGVARSGHLAFGRGDRRGLGRRRRRSADLAGGG
uniref:Uncharacterized protein n=1 Tax=Oryza barthii TaxID=65489 RepID=A0A0D3GW20_9ORYZ